MSAAGNRRTSRTNVKTVMLAVVALVVGMVAQFGVAPAYAADTFSPTITSDLADYNPGGTVTLTGTGWDPVGTAVHVVVNDDDAQSWQYVKDVAVPNGSFTDVFALPNYFVAQYSVVATQIACRRLGAQGDDVVHRREPVRRPRPVRQRPLPVAEHRRVQQLRDRLGQRQHGRVESRCTSRATRCRTGCGSTTCRSPRTPSPSSGTPPRAARTRSTTSPPSTAPSPRPTRASASTVATRRPSRRSPSRPTRR